MQNYVVYNYLRKSYVRSSYVFYNTPIYVEFCSVKTLKMKLKNPEKFEYAERLYLEGMVQKAICEKLTVTQATLSKWKKLGLWEEKRKARNISVDSLITRALMKIDEMLKKDDFSADEFAKAVAPLKSLPKRVTPDDKTSFLIELGRWVEVNIGIEKPITVDFFRTMTLVHDIYILKVLKGNE